MKTILNIFILFLIIAVVIMMRVTMLDDGNDSVKKSSYSMDVYEEKIPFVKPTLNKTIETIQNKNNGKKSLIQKDELNYDTSIKNVSSVPIIKKEDPVAKELREKRESEEIIKENFKLAEFKNKLTTENFFNILKDFPKLEQEITYEVHKLDVLKNVLIQMKIKKFPELREQYADLLDEKYDDYQIYQEDNNLILESPDFEDRNLRKMIYDELKENLEMMNFNYIKFDFDGPIIKRHKIHSDKSDNEI